MEMPTIAIDLLRTIKCTSSRIVASVFNAESFGEYTIDGSSFTGIRSRRREPVERRLVAFRQWRRRSACRWRSPHACCRRALWTRADRKASCSRRRQRSMHRSSNDSPRRGSRLWSGSSRIKQITIAASLAHHLLHSI